MKVSEVILARYRESLQMPTDAELTELMSIQKPDGSFPVVPVFEEGKPDFRFNHLLCVKLLAIAWQKTQKEEYAEKALLGMVWWYNCGFTGALNWYDNSISVPHLLLDILICLQGRLLQQHEQQLIVDIGNARNDERYIYDIGANIIWTMNIQLHYACYLDDEEKIQASLARIEEELRFADDHSETDKAWRNNHWRGYVTVYVDRPVYEGVQRDYAFLEHGPALQTGAYGNAYMGTASALLYELRGLNCLSQNALQHMVNYLLEHYQWTILGQFDSMQDYNVRGRSIGNLQATAASYQPAERRFTLHETVAHLIGCEGGYRQDELKALQAHMQASTGVVEGVKYFPHGKYAVQQTPAMSTSIKTTSRNMVGGESVNWCCMQCWYMGDGTQYFYRDGHEYDDVFVAWDWKKLPGLTASQEAKPTLDWKQNLNCAGSNSTLCGGVALGSNGVSAMQLVHDKLFVKKAWFLMDGESVTLVSDLFWNGQEPVFSTLNQCLWQGDVLLDGKALTEDSLTQEVQCVTHRGLAYCFEQPTTVQVEARGVCKNQHDIDYVNSPFKPEEPAMVTRDIFTLGLPHGKHAEGDCFAYTVLPCEAGATPAPTTKILCNTGALQAVEGKDTCVAVFWQAGKFVWKDVEIETDAPCTCLLKDEKVVVGRLDERLAEITVEKNGVSHVLAWDATHLEQHELV